LNDRRATFRAPRPCEVRLKTLRVDLQLLRFKPLRVPITAALLGLIALITAAEVWAIRERSLEAARARATVAAIAASTYVGQVFGAVSLALQSLDVDARTPNLVLHGTREEMHAILRRAQAASPAMYGLAYVGADGRVAVNAAGVNPPRSDLSDRPFFIAHRGSADPSLLVGAPVVSRPDNRITMSVSKRVEEPDGSFAGMVAARLDPAHFSAFFSKLDADAVSLVDRSGNLYARFPAVDLIAAPARPLPELAERVGDFTFAIPSGDRLLGHAAAVPGTDLFVRAASSEKKMLGTWLRRSTSPVLGALVASFALLAAMRLLRRRADQLAELAAARDADAREANAQATRFRAVARNKSDFLAHMGHELRTPLNAIIGFADILKGDAMKLGLPARYREYAGDIAFSAEHLLEVINRVLDMSKLEAGKWKLELGRVDAAAILSTVAHLAAQRADKEGVTLDTVEPDPRVEFTGDAQVLVQLLLNLTINAIKFAGNDRRVRLACVRRADGHVEFRVADRGAGMSPADAERALRPFETARDAPASGRSDTGLGLPLARMFAELHEGTLELDTAPGRGTTVRVLLPVLGPKAVLAA